MPRVVVEQIRRDATRDPRPAHVLPGAIALVAHRRQRPLERRRARGIASGETDRQTIEQQVDGTRCLQARGIAGRRRRRKRAAAQLASDARRAQRLEVGLARLAGIERLEPLGCVEEQRHSFPGASEVQCDLSVEPLEHGAVELIERPVTRRRQQCQRLLRRPGQLLGLRSRERSSCSPSGVERHRGSPLEERGGSGQSAASLRPRGRPLEFVGDLLVGPDRGMSEVPGPAIGVDISIGGDRQRPMRGSPIIARRRLIDRGPQERVAEGDARPELEHAFPDGGRGRFGRDPELRRRSPQQGWLPGRLGGGQKQ